MIARPTARRGRDDRPCTGRDRVVQHLVHGPRMIGQPGGHRWRPLLPLAPPDGAQAQALMRPAKVVGAADEPHAALDKRRPVGDPAPPPHEGRQVRGRWRSDVRCRRC